MDAANEDDDLVRFEAHGAGPLPAADIEGWLPDGFEQFVADVGEMMRTQPNYTARDLAAIGVPVAIVQGEHDEFIRPEHAGYLARTIPGGTLTILPGVSHFAPLQRPARFNAALLAFLNGLPG